VDSYRWLEDGPAGQQRTWREGLAELLGAVSAADGVPALSEEFVRALEEGTGHRHLLAVDSGTDGAERPIGVLAVDVPDVTDAGGTAEIAVHPDFRRRGTAAGLLREAGRGLDPEAQFSIWAHGNLDACPGARRRPRCARTVRELLKMTVYCGVRRPGPRTAGGGGPPPRRPP
jgi:mycothiol synthase